MCRCGEFYGPTWINFMYRWGDLWTDAEVSICTYEETSGTDVERTLCTDEETFMYRCGENCMYRWGDFYGPM